MTLTIEMAQQMLAMVGATNFAEFTNVTATVNQFVDAAKSLTGKGTTTEALAAMRSMAANSNTLEKAVGKTGDAAVNEVGNLQAFAKSVEAATGAQGAEALAVIAAGKNASARVTTLEAEAAAARKQNEDRDAADAIAKATSEGRLRPAAKGEAEALYAELGLKALNRFLAALVPGAPVTSTSTNPENKQPAPKGEGSDAAAENAAITKRLLAKGFSADEVKAALELPTVIVRDLEKEG
jgi:phage I-like protein